MRIYDYYETCDGMKVTHSDIRPDGSVLVFFDEGDRHATVRLPDGALMANTGFLDVQTDSFRTSTVRGSDAIMRYAAEGGIDHAWAI